MIRKMILYFILYTVINPLSANPTKSLNKLKTICRQFDELSVSGHFVGLALKGLTNYTAGDPSYAWNR